MAKFRDMSPGTKVRASGKFLRSTGQLTGSAGSKVYLVRACECELCLMGKYVSVNERRPADYVAQLWTPEEVAAHPGVVWHHFHKENLVVVGQLDSRNNP